MKRLLIPVACAALIAGPAAAEDTCKTLGNLAHSIMEWRQSGMRMSKLMSIIDANTGVESGKQMARVIVKLAYEVPRYSTPEYQARAEEDFSSQVEAGCYSGGQNG